MKAHLDIKGIDQLMSHLRDATKMDEVKKVAELTNQMQKRAQFKGHYQNGKFISPTGATKRSIIMKIQEAGFSVLVMPRTEYSPYLEFGTRFMNAQPFVRAAFNYQKVIFKKEMRELMA